MLASLFVRDLALFETVSLEFDTGFVALTGQTGAGKSLIVDALSFVSGARADRGIIRHGKDKCEVSAVFSPVGKDKLEKLCEFGIDAQSDAIEFSRTLTTDGRNVCRINGRQTTLSLLRTAAELFLDIHEQEDATLLFDPKRHIAYLDAFEEDTACLRAEYLTAYRAYTTLRDAFNAVYADKDERASRREFLAHQVRELSAAKLRVGEWDELNEQKRKLESSRRLTEASCGAKNALFSEGGAFDQLMTASRLLADASDVVPEWEALSHRLEEVAYEVESASAVVTSPLSGEEDPAAALDRIHTRLSQLRRLFGLYTEGEEALIALLEEKKQELNLIDNAAAEARRLHAEAKEAREVAVTVAERLRAARKSAAHRLEEAVMRELAALDMAGVRFEVSMKELDKLTPDGLDEIEFFIGTNVGMQLAPLRKIASGGELSRILLAIRLVLSDLDGIDTLVFDEIDTGVSGKSAVKIGRAMRTLAARRQVLAVTHSAQVASAAHHHFKVEKSVQGDATLSFARALSRGEREVELARILGGEQISETSLANARELLTESEK